MSSRYGGEGMSYFGNHGLKLQKWNAALFAAAGVKPTCDNGDEDITFVLFQPKGFVDAINC